MDQIKVYLNLAIKHRFWITMGIAALLPMIAYFVGSGPVKKAAADKESLIKSASEGVKPYTGSVINAQYKPLVVEKTEVLNVDVTKSWEKLYNRQASLLTWPEFVESRFKEWGNKWPEGVDPQSVQQAINDYVIAYPDQVTNVYSTFKPFDVETGEGIVSAPPKEMLLRPAPFDTNKLPELGKVWAAQEKLWIQRALLDVVRKVNEDAKAKDWDTAFIKQINTIDVGDQLAQDQISIAAGEELIEAPELAPAAEAAAAEEEVVEEDTGGMGGSSQMMAMMGMMGRGGGPAAATDTVYYIKTDSTQFKVMPVKISVLLDQTRIPEFLIALENSPMAIEVRDFEMSKPTARVQKPVKGVMGSFGMGTGYMGGMEGMMGMQNMAMMGMGREGMPGMGGMRGMGMMEMGGMMGREGMGMMGRDGMGMGTGPVNKGIDKRGENRKAKREEEEKALAKTVVRTIHDPYYNIVEVVVYGQARFYNPPTAPEAEASESASETPAEGETAEPAAPAVADPGVPAGTAEAAPGVEPAKAEAAADAPKAETPADAPKAEAPAAAPADAPKAEAPSDEPKAADEPKAQPTPERS